MELILRFLERGSRNRKISSTKPLLSYVGGRQFDQAGPAPTAAVLAKPFAHGAHAWREDGGKGALVVVIVGRDDVSYPKGVPEKRCSAGD